MSISTYKELKVAIADWCKRSDILTRVDNFIDLAEVDIWSDLRVREMEVCASGLYTSDFDRFAELPDDYIDMRRLKIYICEKPYDIDAVPLKSMDIIDSCGVPSQFAVTSQIEFNRISDQEYQFDIDYYRELLPLSAENPSNAVLIKYPNIYLAASLQYAFRWMRLNDDAEYWKSNYNQAVAYANKKSRRGRYSPAPAMRPIRGMVV